MLSVLFSWLMKGDSILGNYRQQVLNWENFYSLIWQNGKLFLFMLGLLCGFRLAFILIMQNYLGEGSGWADIETALFYGFRLSMKSAGFLTLVSFGLSFLAYWIRPQGARRVTNFCGCGFILVLTLLFFARIPYYEQFHSGFNQLIFNTFKDDTYALFISMMDQFHLPLRLLGVAILAWFICKLFLWWQGWGKIYPLPRLKNGKLTICLRILCLYLFYQCVLFIRFGGSMSYVGDIDWENAGVTKDQLLNEAILDDLQALYRASEMNGRLDSSTGLAFEPSQIRQYGAMLQGETLATNNLDNYLKRHVSGGRENPPRQVFVIVSESYANWVLLDQYANLHIADGMREVIARADSDYIGTMLPNGMSTVSGVMGILTGFADANLYLTHLPEAYQAAYPTAIAVNMKKLGYQTRFWYAGPNSWERIHDFSLAQGFDEFYGRGDYGETEGNVWGCDDEYLYEAVLAGSQPDKMSFNLILNVSNHSPFTVDLAKAGFDKEAVRRALPPEVQDDEELLKQLGHFWYADKMLAQFVKTAREAYPDSVFIIVGDHADRLNIDKTPNLYERYAIPLIVTGVGIDKDSLPKRAAGSHINITATLLELIAPSGFEYYSLGKSLTLGNEIGMNYGFWITPDSIGKTDGDSNCYQFNPEAQSAPDMDKINENVEIMRSISWWRSKYGNQLVK